MCLEDLKLELEAKGIIPEIQAGFRSGRSTIDNIFILNYIANTELINKNGKVYTFFADLSAAFDKINREKLKQIMEKNGINKNLRERIGEIYKETKNVVRVNGEKSDNFWTSKGVRQGCPLSPVLFTLYTAELEGVLQKAQAGGAVIGKEKIWSLAYADDIVLIAKSPEELKEMMRTMEKYLERKELILNASKSKVLIFERGRGKQKREKWSWKQEAIEEVKEFKYLGYYFQKNGKWNTHIKETVRKARITMAQVWGIGERKFKGNVETRMMMFRSLVGSILLCAAEIWGWTEIPKIEKIQEKYIRWILGLDYNTPAYIVLEEIKVEKMRIEAGRKAQKYEERMRREGKNKIILECWNQIKNRKEERRSRWEKEREMYYRRNGLELNQVEEARKEERELGITLKEADIKEQMQEQCDRIVKSRYNQRYQKLRTNSIYFNSIYLTTQYEGRDQKLIARFRCGNEEKKSKFWKNEEDKKCRLCMEKEESLEHLASDCRNAKKSSRTIFVLLKDTGEGTDLMRDIISRRKKQEQEMDKPNVSESVINVKQNNSNS